MQNIYDIETLLYATYNNHLVHCKEGVVLVIFFKIDIGLTSITRVLFLGQFITIFLPFGRGSTTSTKENKGKKCCHSPKLHYENVVIPNHQNGLKVLANSKFEPCMMHLILEYNISFEL